MKLPEKWPVVIKRGNSVVRIYRAVTHGCSEFKVASYDDHGKRRLKSFSDYGEARKHADGITASIADGSIRGVTLAGAELVSYERAKLALADIGVPVDQAAREYVAAIKTLNGAGSIADAITAFMRRHAGMDASKTVKQAVDEFLESRRRPTDRGKRPASAKYLSDLESRLGVFAESFGTMPLARLGAPEIEKFLASLELEPRTWFNYARILKTLFRFAQKKRWYPRDTDPFDGIELDFDDDSEIEIFTPAELTEILRAARAEIIPFLTVGAFAGLRHAEICRLDWGDVKLAQGHIEVAKGKAKTRSRRLVPIQPNLRSWLADHAGRGPVAAFANMSKQIDWLVADVNTAREKDGVKEIFRWKHNGLRHSYVSYRMAVLKNENAVALEAGNSPQMIHRNYRELVTEAAAAAWFAICPDASANVVPMPAARIS